MQTEILGQIPRGAFAAARSVTASLRRVPLVLRGTRTTPISITTEYLVLAEGGWASLPGPSPFRGEGIITL